MNKRTLNVDFETREYTEGGPTIAGYFSIFNNETELYKNYFESIDPGAFENAIIVDDVRALINHDTTLVLGRTSAGTLELKTDERGLYGVIDINENDTDAMNLYNRVKRGDVSQCSFGFDILSQAEEYDDERGEMHVKILDIKLYEVSVCTFPAYKDTEVEARAAEALKQHKDAAQAAKDAAEARANKIKELKERAENVIKCKEKN